MLYEDHPHADLELHSSDGKIFRVRKAHLEKVSTWFKSMTLISYSGDTHHLPDLELDAPAAVISLCLDLAHDLKAPVCASDYATLLCAYRIATLWAAPSLVAVIRMAMLSHPDSTCYATWQLAYTHKDELLMRRSARAALHEPLIEQLMKTGKLTDTLGKEAALLLYQAGWKELREQPTEPVKPATVQVIDRPILKVSEILRSDEQKWIIEIDG